MTLRFYASTLKTANRELTKAITRAQVVENENRRLRHELNQVRRQVGSGSRLWILRRARADALTLALWGLAGDDVTRRAAIARGFSQRRWQWARALLAFAQVTNHGDLVVATMGEAAALIDGASRHLEAHDRRLDALVARLPKGALLVANGTNKSEPYTGRRGGRGPVEKGRRPSS